MMKAPTAEARDCAFLSNCKALLTSSDRELIQEMHDALHQWQWSERHGDAQEIVNSRRARDRVLERASQVHDT